MFCHSARTKSLLRPTLYVSSDFIDTGNMDDEGMKKKLPLCFYFISIKGFTSKIWISCMIDYLSVCADQNERGKKNTFEFFKYCKVGPIRTEHIKAFRKPAQYSTLDFYIRLWTNKIRRGNTESIFFPCTKGDKWKKRSFKVRTKNIYIFLPKSHRLHHRSRQSLQNKFKVQQRC